MSVDSRIMIDAAYFRKVNPNFPIARLESFPFGLENDLPIAPPLSPTETGEVKDADVDVDEMKDEDLLICSPVVYGFSLEDKLWGEQPDGIH